MSLSITKKVVVGATSSIILSGTTGVIYSQFSSINNIREALAKNNKTPLNLINPSEEDYEHLQELAKQYFNGKPSGKERIEGLTLTSETDTEPLKQMCLTLLNNGSGNKDLTNAENWCTIENAPRKISTLLHKRGRVLLNDKDDQAWNFPWKKFKEKYTTKKPTGPWNIKNWDSIKKKDNIPVVFKARCKTNSSGSIMLGKKEKLLSEIEKFCTKSINNQVNQ